MDSQNADRLRAMAKTLIGFHVVVATVSIFGAFVMLFQGMGGSVAIAIFAGAIASVVLAMTIGYGAMCLADLHSHFQRLESPTAKPKLATRRSAPAKDDLPADWLNDDA